MRVLGIDPGFGRTGFGVVETAGGRQRMAACGCIETAPGSPTGARLRTIHLAICGVIAEHHPDVIAVEQLFFKRNVTTALTAAEARGVAVLAAELFGVPQVEYTPAQVKQAVVGYGRADKRQVQEMVRLLLGLAEPPRPDDAADALAVALAHAQSSSYLNRLGVGGGRDAAPEAAPEGGPARPAGTGGARTRPVPVRPDGIVWRKPVI